MSLYKRLLENSASVQATGSSAERGMFGVPLSSLRTLSFAEFETFFHEAILELHGLLAPTPTATPEEKRELLLEFLRCGSPLGATQPVPGLPTVRLDFRGVDLRDRDLSFQDFGFADLSGAQLQRANLFGAEFAFCILDGADFDHANLFCAKIVHSSAIEVNLNWASLEGATVTQVDFSGSANWQLACWAGATVDHETILRSGWGTEDLVELKSQDAGLVSIEKLPPNLVSALMPKQTGLILYFDRELSPFDRFVLDGAVFGTLGPGADCRLAELRQDGGKAIVRYDAVTRGDLDDVAAALLDRPWEGRSRTETAGAPAPVRTDGVLAAEALTRLSYLVRRSERMELWVHSADGPRLQQQWTMPASRSRALVNLLGSMFSLSELRRVMSHEKLGPELLLALPTTGTLEDVLHETVEVLERRGLVDSRLFAILAWERPKRSADIAVVARLYDLEMPTTLVEEPER